MDWAPTVTRGDYERAIAQIKKHIERGDTYQVNYTLRLRAPLAGGDPWEIFLRLANAQEAAYAAYVDTGRFALLSASPELFFIMDGDRLHSKPMKGTAARGLTSDADDALANWLRQSEKNRAENVMIVDMIRNDMGRVAETGSVSVPRLFEVERYPTVWQMTTTVTARTRKPVSEVISALFPCASITGAPKRSTMRIISDQETEPRGVYTGCIGMMRPGRRCQFNVAIRTVVADRGAGMAEYGVGGGILWYSDPSEEYEECRIKSRVLTAARPAFSVLETLLWTPGEGFFLLDKHLERLERTARYFNRAPDREALLQALIKKARVLEGPAKVRVLIGKDAQVRVEASALDACGPDPVRLGVAKTPVSSKDLFLYHKTTKRDVYENARAQCPEADDVVLVNEKGQVTETTIANIVVEKKGKRITPPVSCGLLAGTYRAYLLGRGQVEEGIITLEGLGDADAVYVINSVRKTRRATLV